MNLIFYSNLLFATVNQIQFATVNLNYSNLLATVLPVSYCKNPLKCLTVYLPLRCIKAKACCSCEFQPGIWPWFKIVCPLHPLSLWN